MGVKTFAVFKTDLLLELGQRDDLDSYTGGFVNAAYMKICTQDRFWGLRKSFNFPELDASDTSQATTDGTAYVDVPSDALLIYTVFDETNNTKLKNISKRRYWSYDDRDTATAEGEPTEWVRIGDYIYLYPTPDDEYDLDILYRKRPTLLTGTGATVLGDEWDEIILQTAVIIAHMKLGEFDKAEAKKAEWLDAVGGLIGIYDQEELDRKDIRSLNYGYKNRKY